MPAMLPCEDSGRARGGISAGDWRGERRRLRGGRYAVGLLKEATGSTSGAFVALAALASAAAMFCLVLGRWAATQKPKRQITG
jgi:hypothetical protein